MNAVSEKSRSLGQSDDCAACEPLKRREAPDAFQVVVAELRQVEQRLLLPAAEHAERLRVEVLQQRKLWGQHNVGGLFTARATRQAAISRELLAYLNALDEVPHGEVVVEENTHQHLHHSLVELEREVRRQDQLDTRNRRDEKLTLMKFLGSVTLKTCCDCAVTLSMTVARC